MKIENKHRDLSCMGLESIFSLESRLAPPSPLKPELDTR